MSEKDYAQMNLFSLFPAVLIERCSGELSEALVAAVFIKYTILLWRLFKRS